VHIDQCVSTIGAVEVPVFVCLRSSCNYVTDVGGPYGFGLCCDRKMDDGELSGAMTFLDLL
jgi:hypothetical protein